MQTLSFIRYLHGCINKTPITYILHATRTLFQCLSRVKIDP